MIWDTAAKIIFDLSLPMPRRRARFAFARNSPKIAQNFFSYIFIYEWFLIRENECVGVGLNRRAGQGFLG